VKKDLKYYLSLNYPIEIIKIPDDEGGGFSACIPLLGRSAFIADGETVDEAINNLNLLKKESFGRMIENGIPIQEPVEEKEEPFSGKFLVRVPKELHRSIAQRAKQNNISLNQYIQYLLTTGLMNTSFEQVIESYCHKFDKVIQEMKNVEFTYDLKNEQIYEDYPTQQTKIFPIDKKVTKYPKAV
jgi:antitoxin HicB